MFQWIQFASDLGGTVGLYLGASIVTIIELVDLSIRLCHYCYRKEHFKKASKLHWFYLLLLMQRR